MVKATQPSDWASIIYTSGTTGDPKGAILSHGNFMSNVRESLKVFHLDTRDVCLSFLPLSHVFERMAGFYTMMTAGVVIAYAESIESVPENLREVSPRVPIPQISSPPASSQTPSSQTPSSQPASSQPASSQPASSQPARGDDVHASEPEPQRTNAARAAAAPFASGSDGKPFLFDHLFEVCPGFKLSLEPIQNAIPTVVIDDFLKRPEEARDGTRIPDTA